MADFRPGHHKAYLSFYEGRFIFLACILAYSRYIKTSLVQVRFCTFFIANFWAVFARQGLRE